MSGEGERERAHQRKLNVRSKVMIDHLLTSLAISTQTTWRIFHIQPTRKEPKEIIVVNVKKLKINMNIYSLDI